MLMAIRLLSAWKKPDNHREKEHFDMTARQEWLEMMLKIASPVLENLSQERLYEKIPKEFHPDRKEYILLEAFGRTVNGMAPWLELEGLEGEEGALQEKYRKLARTCMDKATNPASRDYMNFGKVGGQPLVDAGFLAHAIIRAPKQLFFLLDERVKKNVAAALKATRRIVPCPTNWLFFSAMVEAALYVMGESDYDRIRIDYAEHMFEKWYKGGGVYGDGEEFCWDYYNSYVIQPMYVDILRTMEKEAELYQELKPKVEERAEKYAAVLERMIAPDGTYPILGRSSTYRFGAFQMLSQAALEHLLPKEIVPAQVRCALTAVIRKVAEPDALFDKDGWLLPGIYGCQPQLADSYICTGSLYLCMSVFLPMGLPPADLFWSGADCEWSSRKVWTAAKE